MGKGRRARRIESEREVGGGEGLHVGRMDAGEERGRVSEGNREGRLYTYYMIHYYNRDLIGASVSEPHTSESNWDFSFLAFVVPKL